jgi:hypothetical protein
VGGIVGKWLGEGEGAGVIGVGKGLGCIVGTGVGETDGSDVGAGVGVMVGAVVSTDAEAALTSAMLETPISVAKDTTTVSSVPAEMAVAISAVTLLNTSSSCYTRHKDRKKGRKRVFSAN